MWRIKPARIKILIFNTNKNAFLKINSGRSRECKIYFLVSGPYRNSSTKRRLENKIKILIKMGFFT